MVVEAYTDQLEQFHDTLSFLWEQRDGAFDKPSYTFKDVADIERRMHRLAPVLSSQVEIIWSYCESQLEFETGGEAFVAALVAGNTQHKSRMNQVIKKCIGKPAAERGLVSAFLWLSDAIQQAWLKTFWQSHNLDWIHLAIRIATKTQWATPKLINDLLSKPACKNHGRLYARVLRIAGEHKVLSAQPCLSQGMTRTESEAAFWAARSLALFGESQHAALERWVLLSGPRQKTAIEIYFRTAPLNEAQATARQLLSTQENMALGIYSLGILGDPKVAPWLLKQMQNPMAVPLCAYALSMITGWNWAALDLEDDFPETWDDEAFDNYCGSKINAVNLPYINVQKLKNHWQVKGRGFRPGIRYLYGQILSELRDNPFSLQQKLKTHSTHKRKAIALWQSILLPGEPLLNTKAMQTDKRAYGHAN